MHNYLVVSLIGLGVRYLFLIMPAQVVELKNPNNKDNGLETEHNIDSNQWQEVLHLIHQIKYFV